MNERNASNPSTKRRDSILGGRVRQTDVTSDRFSTGCSRALKIGTGQCTTAVEALQIVGLPIPRGVVILDKIGMRLRLCNQRRPMPALLFFYCSNALPDWRSERIAFALSFFEVRGRIPAIVLANSIGRAEQVPVKFGNLLSNLQFIYGL